MNATLRGGLMHKLGDFVLVDRSIGVIVKTGEMLHAEFLADGYENDSSEDHLGIWFGESVCGRPLVKVVPAEYCIPMNAKIEYCH